MRSRRGGGEPRRLTDFAGDVGSYKLSPDGKRIAFSAEAFADCGSDLACSPKRMEERASRRTAAWSSTASSSATGMRGTMVASTACSSPTLERRQGDAEDARRWSAPTSSATCRRARSATAASTRGRPTAEQLVLSARKADREEPCVDQLRPVPGQRRWQRRGEEPDRGQSGLGHRRRCSAPTARRCTTAR